MVGRELCGTMVGMVLLSGCAAAQPTAARPAPEAQCSFRSTTTCWTFAARFPVRRAPTAPFPDEPAAPAAAVLASVPDSITVSR